ncbi:MAG: hypothetical protein J7K04_16360 [Spirochaetales bacterium]|nr:hypothetical protein [Spirochaetales bacterium]
MKKILKSAIFLIFLIFSPLLVEAEILRLPPVELLPVFTPSLTLLSGIEGWFNFLYYTDNAGDEYFSHDSEMGILFTLLSTKEFSLQAFTREIIQNQVNSIVESSLGFWLRALITDLRLTATLNAGLFYIQAGFRHDCKHDIDRFLGRNAVHDVLFLSLLLKEIKLRWQVSAFFSSFKIGLLGEKNLPYIFQEVKPEPDKSQISLSAELALIAHPRYGSLFVNGKVSSIRRKTIGTEVNHVIDPAVDWHIQLGYRTPCIKKSAVLYYQIEYITDPWVNNDLKPHLLKSVGFVISIKG